MAVELAQKVKDKIEEAIVLWADDNLIGRPSILATAVFYSLEATLIAKQKEIEERFPLSVSGGKFERPK